MISLGLSINLNKRPVNGEPGWQDTAAALVVDGAVVSAIDAKKLQRGKKNTHVFATVRYVLRDYGIRLNQVDKIDLWLDDEDAASYQAAGLPGSAGDYIRAGLQDVFAVDISDVDVSLNGPLRTDDKHTASGVMAAALKLYRRHSLAQPSPGDTFAPPGTELEKILAGIWQKILSKEKIGIDDNFFHLGGNSLTAIVLENEIHKAFNKKLPLAEIFKFPTIKELSNCLRYLPEIKYTALLPVEKKEYYAISSAQKRLYIVQHLDLDSTAYNLHSAIPLPPELEAGKLAGILKELTARHESLRTSFEMVTDEVVQRVHNNVTVEIEYCRDQPGDSPLKVEEILGNFIKPFDLSCAPLMRVKLVKSPKSNDLLLVDMHHIISDGLSNSLLMRDFAALAGGEKLPPLRFQYKEYSERQNHPDTREIIDQQEAYWLETFVGEVPVVELPGSNPRPASQSFAGKNIQFEISLEESTVLRQIARRQAATLFMVLLALTNIFISKLSGQEDIIIGTPTAGRGHADFEQIIGMFVNTLALRNYPVGGKTFVEFLKQVKDCTLKAFANQDYPFEKLVEKLSIQWPPNRNPLFDVMLTLQNFDSREQEAAPRDQDNQEAANDPYENPGSQFDLSLDVVEDQRLFFVLNYNTQLFNEDTIREFIRYFKDIISMVVENRNIRLNEINLVENFVDQENILAQEDGSDFIFL
jgi:acyl carrier protein